MPPKTKKPTAEQVRAERIDDAYLRASVAVTWADAALAKGLPHSPDEVATLAKAAKSLNAYLAELER